MSLSNLMTTTERQQLDAAYAKTAECLARYQRCKGILDTNAKFADGKTRTREWLEGITDTAERERCRTVMNNIITAKRHYAKKD